MSTDIPEPVREQILDAVTKRTGMARSVVIGEDRRAVAVHARRVAAIAFRLLGYTLPQIGRAMRCDHTSVLRLVNPSSRQGALQLPTARKAAADVLERAEVKYEATLPAEPVDNDLARWRLAVEEYDQLPEPYRSRAWEAAMRQLFPTSWRHQAANPPRIVRERKEAA